ncbi:hypothetical protein C0J52_00206 [Blattella germanica]|nr:hypothetical protein C0J52_00206 [Blattella germanica]
MPTRNKAVVKGKARAVVHSIRRDGLRSGGQLPPGSEAGLKSERVLRQSEQVQPRLKPVVKKKKIVPEKNINKTFASSVSDFSSDDDQPLAKKMKPIERASSSRQLARKVIKRIVNKRMKPRMVTRSQQHLQQEQEEEEGEVEKSSSAEAKAYTRPSRKTKEAAAIYMELLGRKLITPEAEIDEDSLSIDSFPELPNARKIERRESELKAKASKEKKEAEFVKEGNKSEPTQKLKSESGNSTPHQKRVELMKDRKLSLQKKKLRLQKRESAKNESKVKNVEPVIVYKKETVNTKDKNLDGAERGQQLRPRRTKSFDGSLHEEMEILQESESDKMKPPSVPRRSLRRESRDALPPDTHSPEPVQSKNINRKVKSASSSPSPPPAARHLRKSSKTPERCPSEDKFSDSDEEPLGKLALKQSNLKKSAEETKESTGQEASTKKHGKDNNNTKKDGKDNSTKKDGKDISVKISKDDSSLSIVKQTEDKNTNALSVKAERILKIPLVQTSRVTDKAATPLGESSSAKIKETLQKKTDDEVQVKAKDPVRKNEDVKNKDKQPKKNEDGNSKNKELSKKNEDGNSKNKEMSKKNEDGNSKNKEMSKKNEDGNSKNKEMSKKNEDGNSKSKEMSKKNEDGNSKNKETVNKKNEEGKKSKDAVNKRNEDASNKNKEVQNKKNEEQNAVKSKELTPKKSESTTKVKDKKIENADISKLKESPTKKAESSEMTKDVSNKSGEEEILPRRGRNKDVVLKNNEDNNKGSEELSNKNKDLSRKSSESSSKSKETVSKLCEERSLNRGAPAKKNDEINTMEKETMPKKPEITETGKETEDITIRIKETETKKNEDDSKKKEVSPRKGEENFPAKSELKKDIGSNVKNKDTGNKDEKEASKNKDDALKKNDISSAKKKTNANVRNSVSKTEQVTTSKESTLNKLEENKDVTKLKAVAHKNSVDEKSKETSCKSDDISLKQKEIGQSKCEESKISKKELSEKKTDDVASKEIPCKKSETGNARMRETSSKKKEDPVFQHEDHNPKANEAPVESLDKPSKNTDEINTKVELPMQKSEELGTLKIEKCKDEKPVKSKLGSLSVKIEDLTAKASKAIAEGESLAKTKTTTKKEHVSNSADKQEKLPLKKELNVMNKAKNVNSKKSSSELTRSSLQKPSALKLEMKESGSKEISKETSACHVKPVCNKEFKFDNSSSSKKGLVTSKKHETILKIPEISLSKEILSKIEYAAKRSLDLSDSEDDIVLKKLAKQESTTMNEKVKSEDTKISTVLGKASSSAVVKQEENKLSHTEKLLKQEYNKLSQNEKQNKLSNEKLLKEEKRKSFCNEKILKQEQNKSSHIEKLSKQEQNKPKSEKLKQEQAKSSIRQVVNADVSVSTAVDVSTSAIDEKLLKKKEVEASEESSSVQISNVKSSESGPSGETVGQQEKSKILFNRESSFRDKVKSSKINMSNEQIEKWLNESCLEEIDTKKDGQMFDKSIEQPNSNYISKEQIAVLLAKEAAVFEKRTGENLYKTAQDGLQHKTDVSSGVAKNLQPTAQSPKAHESKKDSDCRKQDVDSPIKFPRSLSDRLHNVKLNIIKTQQMIANAENRGGNSIMSVAILGVDGENLNAASSYGGDRNKNVEDRTTETQESTVEEIKEKSGADIKKQDSTSRSPSNSKSPMNQDRSGEKKSIFQRRSFPLKTKERKDLTPSANAFSPENESSVYAFDSEPELPPINTPFRRRARDSRTSSTTTSKSEEDLARLDDELTPPHSVQPSARSSPVNQPMQIPASTCSIQLIPSSAEPIQSAQLVQASQPVQTVQSIQASQPATSTQSIAVTPVTSSPLIQSSQSERLPVPVIGQPIQTIPLTTAVVQIIPTLPLTMRSVPVENYVTAQSRQQSQPVLLLQNDAVMTTLKTGSTSSTSIAVQVNLDNEASEEVPPQNLCLQEPATPEQKSMECSTQTDVTEEEEDDSEGHLFYIPLQQPPGPGGPLAAPSQQLIQGVAVKLGTEGPTGPNQRVIMRAKLVTKPPNFNRTATGIQDGSTLGLGRSVLTTQHQRSTGMILAEQKNIYGSGGGATSTVTTGTYPPVGTVQPTARGRPLVTRSDAMTDTVQNTDADLPKPASPTKATEKSPAVYPQAEVNPPMKKPLAMVPAKPILSKVQSQGTLSSSAGGSQTKSSSVNVHVGKPRRGSTEVNSPGTSGTKSNAGGGKRGSQKMKSYICTPSNTTKFPSVGSPAQMVEAPIFHPTEKEFQDPLEYIDRIRPVAEKFGLCRVVPPPNFKPECKVSDDMRFLAYNQYVNKMLHRWGPNVKEMMAIKKYLATQSICFNHPPWIGGMEVDLPRLYKIVQSLGGLKEVIEKKKWQRVADGMKIPKSAQDRVTKLDDIYCKYLLPYDTLSPDERQKLFDDVEKEWEEREKRTAASSNSGSDTPEDESEGDASDENEECIVKGRNMPLNAFYRIARNTMSMWFRQAEPPATDVEQEFWRHVTLRQSHVCVHSGSIDSSGWGYGFPCSKNSPFARHPWNLKVLTNNSGSILRSIGPIMGVTVPTLHVGMLFTTCCWYRDPHGLPWVEYLHTGASKIWRIVPSIGFAAKYGIPDEYSSVFRSALTKLVPRYVKNKTIWLPSDTAMVPPPMLDIRDSCEPSMFSLERLLFSIATDGRTNVEVLKQILPMVLQIRQQELDHRKQLYALGLKTSERLPLPEANIKRRKARQAREEEGDYECEMCRANLFVSLVSSLFNI